MGLGKKMVEYKCKKCRKVFSNKTDYERHLNRKTECNGSKTNKKVKTVKCNNCKKKLSRKDALIRHLRTCKKKNKEVIMEKINNGVENKIDIEGNNNKIENKITNTTNNITINMGPDCSMEDLKKILKSGNLFEGIILVINFNPEKPQHHGMYWEDTKSAYGKIYENDKWVTKKINEIMEKLLDAKVEDLNMILNEMEDFLNDKTVKKIKETLETVDFSKSDSRKKLKTYLKPILYDNKDMVIETRKKTEMWEE